MIRSELTPSKVNTQSNQSAVLFLVTGTDKQSLIVNDYTVSQERIQAKQSGSKFLLSYPRDLISLTSHVPGHWWGWHMTAKNNLDELIKTFLGRDVVQYLSIMLKTKMGPARWLTG